jgi:hypothetical protein
MTLVELFNKLVGKIKVPESKLGCFVFCFASQLLSFFIIASNFRFLAKGLYIATAVTDGLIVLLSSVMAKLMIENVKTRDGLAILGYTIGGMCGSLLSIYVTKHFFGI